MFYVYTYGKPFTLFTLITLHV